MKTRSFLLVMLFIVAGLGLWQFNARKDQLRDYILKKTGLSQLFGGYSSYDNPAAFVEPVPEIQPATIGQMFPFSAEAPELESVVELPAKRVPLVYVAYCGNSDDQFTSVSKCFGEFYKFQIQAHEEGPILLNTVPNNDMWIPFRRAFQTNTEQVSYEKYLYDAQELGCDYLFVPVYDGGTTDPRVTVRFVDMKSSRTETWSSEQAGISSPGDILANSAVASLKFLGYTDEDLNKIPVRLGAPSDATFAWAVSTNEDDKTFEAYMDILKTDPDCRFVYTGNKGTTWVGQLNEVGLHRFPRDSRLIIRKASYLQDSQTSTALGRYVSELIRSYPDHIFCYSNLAERLNVVYSRQRNAQETPPIFQTMIDQQGLICDRYPEFYPLAWTQAYLMKTTADYIRGTNTVDKIPYHVMELRSELMSDAYDIMWDLADAHSDSYPLMKSFVYYDRDVGTFDLESRLDYIKTIHELDPRDVEVESEFAFMHSVGYGRPADYFTIMDTALKNHENDVEALKSLGGSLEFELRRQIGWKLLTQDKAYSTANPYGARFVKLAEFVYSKGQNLGMTADETYYRIIEKTDTEKLKSWEESGQNSYYAGKLAQEAHERGDWQTCLKYAELAVPHTEIDRHGELAHYYVIKSLWKLKRYDEGMKKAREGIFKFPNCQSFPYMYAVVALEAEKNLETAYDCAWRAVDLGTDNPGCNETFEKIRAKLNRPDHPSLVAMKN